MKTFLLYLVLGSVILSSACTGSGNPSPDALVFTDLRFTESAVTDKDVVSFMFEVQNQGRKEITFAKVFFYGLPNIAIPPQSMTETSSLKPPTKEGAVGDRYGNSFTLDLMQAGFDFPQGTRQTYELQSRLVYNYSAEASTTFTALTREAYLQEKQRGKDPKSRAIELNSLGGPIQISIKTEQPLIFYTENGATNARLLFHIRNVGEGTPVSSFDESASVSTFDIKQTNKVGRLTVLLNGNIVPCSEKEIPLFNNEAEVYCQISLDRPIVEQEYRLEASIPYYYVVDKKTPLTIEGTRAS